MSAHALLNLLNLLEKRIRCIYIYIYIYIYSFVKQIAGLLIIKDTNLISIFMFRMPLHKAQTQHEVIFTTGFLLQRQGDQ